MKNEFIFPLDATDYVLTGDVSMLNLGNVLSMLGMSKAQEWHLK